VSAAETMAPPTPPDDCRAWPGCGLEVRGECPCVPREARPTLRMAPHDPVAAYWRLRAERALLMGRVDRIDEALATQLAGMTDADRARLDGQG
jgi:hypothetical protein